MVFRLSKLLYLKKYLISYLMNQNKIKNQGLGFQQLSNNSQNNDR